MEATQSYPNLLSEKQAAKRLGVAGITLLRAREAGRIRFFRIGTRVLYCAEHLTEFLNACERNRHKAEARYRSITSREERTIRSIPRGNRVPFSQRGKDSATESAKADQARLPFSATR